MGRESEHLGKARQLLQQAEHRGGDAPRRGCSAGGQWGAGSTAKPSIKPPWGTAGWGRLHSPAGEPVEEGSIWGVSVVGILRCLQVASKDSRYP